MSRDPGYTRAGATRGYTNGSYGNGTAYGGYSAPSEDNGERTSGDRRRRPGGYGGISAPNDDYPRRPSGEPPSRRPGGYGGASRDMSRDEDFTRRPSGDSDRRRPGGYGGTSAPREEDAPQVTRPTSIERSQARRRSGERQLGSARTRPGGNYGPGSQRIEEVLHYIQQKWPFMTQDQCVPIEVALKLMDSSSLGLANQAGQFQQTHEELQQALKGIVNGRILS